MKAPAFDYARADNAEHAATLLEQSTGFSKLIAGGQSLTPMLNYRLTQPELLVDVRACEDMRTVTDDDSGIIYGAAVTHAEIEDGRVRDITGGWLQHIARGIAYRAVRNRGTIGGSLAHADPAADWPPVLLALHAEVIVRSTAGLTSMSLEHFFAAPFTTALGPGDVLVGVRIPRPSSKARFAAHKLAIKRGEFAQSMVAIVDDESRQGLTVVLGALEQPPKTIAVTTPLPNNLANACDWVGEHVAALPATANRLHAATLLRALNKLSVSVATT